MSQPVPPAEGQPGAQPVDYSAYASAHRPARATTPGQDKNPLGLFAAIAGAAGVLLGAFFTLVQAAVAGTGNYSALGAVGGLSTVLTVLLGLAALILGGIALLTRRGSRVFAAVGVALGASFLISGIVGLLYSLILQISSGY
jgi:hypothetical protein